MGHRQDRSFPCHRKSKPMPRMLWLSLPVICTCQSRSLPSARTEWTSLTVPQWYGAGERTVAIAPECAVRYHTGLPPVPIRWVLIRDPQGKFTIQVLLCTDSEAAPAQVIARFVQRWQMEVTFEEARRPRCWDASRS